jgi:hypothetical protein
MATSLKTVGQIIEQSDERRGLNIAQRIAAVMGEVDYVQKEKKAGMQYTIVSHDAVTAKVRPLLHKHGVVYYPRDLHVSQDGNRTQARFTVRFENIDDRSDHIDVETFGYGVDSQDKGPGKAMSYGVKYALLKVLGLETGDDPDTDQSAKADHVPTRQENIAAHKDDPFPQGPAKNKTDLKEKGRVLWRDVEACGDEDELSILLVSNRPLIAQLKDGLPAWWSGGRDKEGQLFEGLGQVIERQERDLANSR